MPSSFRMVYHAVNNMIRNGGMNHNMAERVGKIRVCYRLRAKDSVAGGRWYFHPVEYDLVEGEAEMMADAISQLHIVDIVRIVLVLRHEAKGTAEPTVELPNLNLQEPEPLYHKATKPS